MDKSSTLDISIDAQREAWNRWNTPAARTHKLTAAPTRQAMQIERWLAGSCDLRILDAGCGSGWMAERLLRFGHVTAVDLADSVIAEASERAPKATFVAGDILSMSIPNGPFDCIVSLELLSHVVNQLALVARFASLLKPGGTLMLATQNRPVLERDSAIGGPIPGQIRRWVDAESLRNLLAPHFRVAELTSVVPAGNQGFLRIVNSSKLNRLLGTVVGLERIEHLKERCLFGHTLMVRAIRSAS